MNNLNNNLLPYMTHYSDVEKNILFNFFIKEGRNSKSDFLNFLSVIDTNPSYNFDKLYDVNNNLVTFLFSHPNFVLSNTKLKNLIRLNVNFDFKNNLNQNFIFNISNKNIFNFSTVFNNKHQINIDWSVIDIYNNNFLFYLFDEKSYSSLSNSKIDYRLANQIFYSIPLIFNIVSSNTDVLLFSKDYSLLLKSKINKFFDFLQNNIFTYENPNIDQFILNNFKDNTLKLNQFKLDYNKIIEYSILNHSIPNNSSNKIYKL